MRPIIKTTLCALAAAAVAAPAFAASSDYYLKFGDIKPVLSKAEGGTSAAKASSGKQIEILSWSWGAPSSAKYGAVAGAHRDDSVAGDARSDAHSGAAPRDAGSGIPTEKRQHGWVTFAAPVASNTAGGAVRVKVKFPWLDCKVGAAFPDAVLQNDAGRYELENVLISGCAPDSVTLDYAKVRVRGWDPEKKE
ncbi:MAG: hypothetical protein ABI770_05870 [Sphingomicrobium sp.]